jgi:hypothetical protein
MSSILPFLQPNWQAEPEKRSSGRAAKVNEFRTSLLKKVKFSVLIELLAGSCKNLAVPGVETQNGKPEFDILSL